MGRTLLRGYLRRRKSRRVHPCHRLCNCYGDERSKPFLRPKFKRKTSNRSWRASIEVKLSKNRPKSVHKLISGYFNVRGQLKQVIVNVTRLSEDVLRVLSENGSIYAYNVSSEGVCKLSPTSNSGGSPCLVTPTRRLRSTPVLPVVRQNVMDRLCELNADWRSTTYPSGVNCSPSVSSDLWANIQDSELSMKTLFLENLSICKKMSSDESTKENFKMSQMEENLATVVNHQYSQSKAIAMSESSPSKVRIVQIPDVVKSMPNSNSKSPDQLVTQPKVAPITNRHSTPRYVVYHTLLGKPSSGELGEPGKNPPAEFVLKKNIGQKFHSFLMKPSLSPLVSYSKKSVTPTLGVPQTPFKPSKSLKSKISSIDSSIQKNESQEDDEVQIIDTCSSVSPSNQKRPLTSSQKPKNLVESSQDAKLHQKPSDHKSSDKPKVKSSSSLRSNISVVGSSIQKNKSQDDNEVQIIDTCSSISPSTQKRPRRSSQKPKILAESSQDAKLHQKPSDHKSSDKPKVKSSSSLRSNISVVGSSIKKNESQDDNEVQIIDTCSSVSPSTQKRPRRSSQKPKILAESSQDAQLYQGQSDHKSSNKNCGSKNDSSTSVFISSICSNNSRDSRRKQSLVAHSGCSGIRPSKLESGNEVFKLDDKSLEQHCFKRTNASAYSSRSKGSHIPKVHDTCSSPKKQKIAPTVAMRSKSLNCSSLLYTKQVKSDVPPPKKSQGNDKIHTIVLDSSEDEHIVEKAVPVKPAAAKTARKTGTPIRRSTRNKPHKQAAAKTIPLKSKRSVRSNDSKGNANNSRTLVASSRVPKRKHSLRNRYPRNVKSLEVSDSESQELSSDSEAEPPKYVSRTGRYSIPSGCRSCPGCKIDVPNKKKPNQKHGCEIDAPQKKKPKQKPGYKSNINTLHKEEPKLKSARKGRKPQPKLPSPDEDSTVSENVSYIVAHADSEEPIEDFLRTPEAPPIVVIHGLISSESSDEESLGIPKKTKTAGAVVPDMDVRKCTDSLSGSEVMEEVTKAADTHSRVTGVASFPAKISSKPKSDCEGSDHVGSISEPRCNLPDAGEILSASSTEILSEGAPSSLSAVAPSGGFASAMNHVPQTSNSQVPELPGNKAETDLNPPMLDDACHHLQYLNEEVASPAIQNSITDMEIADHEIDGSPDSPHSAIKVECYLSHHDFSGRLLLDEINSESSEGGNIPCAPLLADNSSESSSTVENFNFHDYVEYESTCSSHTSSMSGALSQGVSAPVEGQVYDCSSEDRDLGPSCVDNGLQLCHPRILTEGDPQTREALLENSKLSPPKFSETVSEHSERDASFGAQEDKVAAASQTPQEDLASEHGLVPQNGVTKIRSRTPDRYANEDSSLDIAVPGVIPVLQGEVRSTVHFSKRGDLVKLDRPENGECQDIQDSRASLDDSASQEHPHLCGDEHTTVDMSPMTLVVPNILSESEKDSVLTRGQLLHNDVTEKNVVEGKACHINDSGRQDGSLQEKLNDKVTLENHHTAQPSPQPSARVIPEVLSLLRDSQNESALKPVTDQNGTPEKSRVDHYQTFDVNRKVLEIYMLEGCPSCKGVDSSSVSDYQDCYANLQASSSDNQASLERSSLPRESPKYRVVDKQEGTFYHAISNLMIDCLNNMVESVKLDNREVIIKKVNSESPKNDPETDPANQEGAQPAEVLTSLVRELNLPVSLNPRLTIKKLPFTPLEGKSDCEIHVVSHDYMSQVSSSDNHKNSPKDHQVPENSCSSNTTPTVSLYESKGYPTPIKRLDPRVLSVIKYNDLDIYNDEPSFNDSPESDRVECVSSNGIRIELNPNELSNIEAFLNPKISCMRDKGIQRLATDVDVVTSREIDELVIYNDEPPLNLTPIKCRKLLPALLENEDLEDLEIDNDAPPLNEPADPGDKPSSNDPEFMVISSDDEVLMTSGPLKDVPHTEATSVPEAAPDTNSKPLASTRKKLSRKRRKFRNLKTPSIIDLQRSQMELRGQDPHDYIESRNQQFFDLSELECPSDVIGEIIIDDCGAETVHQTSWEPLPPFQSCREVLHQPQVFNRQGQPLLGLDTFNHISGPNFTVASSSQDTTSSHENVFPASQVTFNLSETFSGCLERESLNISGSDTPTTSEETVFPTPHATFNLSETFSGCLERESLNISGSDTPTASEETVFPAPHATFNLSETFNDPLETECLNVSDSDTLTSLECEDEVIVISPPKSSSNLNRCIRTYNNGCDTEGIVQSMDTDSDDDVMMMSDVTPVSSRLQNLRTPMIPSSVEHTDLRARERKMVTARQNRQIRVSSLFHNAQVRSIQTANGTSYHVLVVPPNNSQVNPRR